MFRLQVLNVLPERFGCAILYVIGGVPCVLLCRKVAGAPIHLGAVQLGTCAAERSANYILPQEKCGFLFSPTLYLPMFSPLPLTKLQA